MRSWIGALLYRYRQGDAACHHPGGCGRRGGHPGRHPGGREHGHASDQRTSVRSYEHPGPGHRRDGHPGRPGHLGGSCADPGRKIQAIAPGPAARGRWHTLGRPPQPGRSSGPGRSPERGRSSRPGRRPERGRAPAAPSGSPGARPRPGPGGCSAARIRSACPRQGRTTVRTGQLGGIAWVGQVAWAGGGAAGLPRIRESYRAAGRPERGQVAERPQPEPATGWPERKRVTGWPAGRSAAVARSPAGSTPRRAGPHTARPPDLPSAPAAHTTPAARTTPAVTS